MYLNISLRRVEVIIVLLTCINILLLTTSASAISQDEAAGLEFVGINPDAADPVLIQRLNGGCETIPYPELEKFRSNNGVKITPHNTSQGGSTIADGINPVLACRLLKFLQYARQTKNCDLKIESAYRSAQKQYEICGNGGPNCGSPGSSCHQYGLAVDLVGSGSCMAWAKSFLGSKNPGSPGAQQFKLHWPITSDDGHTQCIENMRGNCATVRTGCDGSGINIATNMDLVTRPSNPFQNAMQNLQNLFTPPSTQQCSPGSVLLNGSCVPQQSQAFTQTNSPLGSILSGSTGSSGNGNSPVGTGSGITVGQGIGGTGNTNTNSNQNTGSNTNVSDLIDSGSDTKKGTTTSAIDLISAIANPTTTPGGAKGTTIGKSVSLNDSLENKTTLNGTLASSTTLAGGSVSTLTPVASQTFVSDDLSKTPARPQLVSTNSTFALLENIRIVLVNILMALRPFGGVVPRAAAANSATAVLE